MSEDEITTERSTVASNVKHVEVYDEIKSGDSKFKVYSFEPSSKPNEHEQQKCIDFWKFLDSTGFEPLRGCKLNDEKPETEREEEGLNWKDVFDLMKSKNLHKLATSSNCKKCKICGGDHESCDAEVSSYLDNLDKDKDRGFDANELRMLDTFEPNKKFYADASTLTDPIYVQDAACQTDFKTDEEMKNEKMEAAYKDFDDFLKLITDMYNVEMDAECKCPKCRCKTIYPAKKSISSVLSGPLSERKDQCICPCGQKDCLCSEYRAIIREIERANDSFDHLSDFEIQKCTCTSMVCDCLQDYELLLKTKLAITKHLHEKLGTDYSDNKGVRCECSCQQINCPCHILKNLYQEVDKIMLGIENDEEYSGCMCSSITCSCMNLYKKEVEEELLEKRVDYDQYEDKLKVEGAQDDDDELVDHEEKRCICTRKSGAEKSRICVCGNRKRTASKSKPRMYSILKVKEPIDEGGKQNIYITRPSKTVHQSFASFKDEDKQGLASSQYKMDYNVSPSMVGLTSQHDLDEAHQAQVYVDKSKHSLDVSQYKIHHNASPSMFGLTSQHDYIQQQHSVGFIDEDKTSAATRPDEKQEKVDHARPSSSLTDKSKQSLVLSHYEIQNNVSPSMIGLTSKLDVDQKRSSVTFLDQSKQAASVMDTVMQQEVDPKRPSSSLTDKSKQSLALSHYEIKKNVSPSMIGLTSKLDVDQKRSSVTFLNKSKQTASVIDTVMQQELDLKRPSAALKDTAKHNLTSNQYDMYHNVSPSMVGLSSQQNINQPRPSVLFVDTSKKTSTTNQSDMDNSISPSMVGLTSQYDVGRKRPSSILKAKQSLSSSLHDMSPSMVGLTSKYDIDQTQRTSMFGLTAQIDLDPTRHSIYKDKDKHSLSSSQYDIRHSIGASMFGLTSRHVFHTGADFGGDYRLQGKPKRLKKFIADFCVCNKTTCQKDPKSAFKDDPCRKQDAVRNFLQCVRQSFGDEKITRRYSDSYLLEERREENPLAVKRHHSI